MFTTNGPIIVISLFLSSFVRAQAQHPVDEFLHPSWLVNQVVSDRYESLYGTALLVGIAENRLLFVTNAHVLPNQGDRPDIQVRTPLFHYQSKDVTLLAVAPDYDLALVSLSAEGMNRSRDDIRKLIASSYSAVDLAGTRQDLSLAGFPGWPQVFHDHRVAINPFYWQKKARVVQHDIYVFAEGMAVERPRFCPPAALRSCYLVPILSWGFSGGALLFLDRERRQTRDTGVRINGLVSHFEPGSPRTYVIPFRVIEAFVSEARQHPGDPPLMIDWDLQTEERVVVDGADSRLRRAHVAGGVTSGGGGVTSGGGGVTSGGGGPGEEERGTSDEDLPAGNLVRRGPDFAINREGTVAYLGDFSALQNEFRRPNRWHRADLAPAFVDLLSRSTFSKSLVHQIRYAAQEQDGEAEYYLPNASAVHQSQFKTEIEWRRFTHTLDGVAQLAQSDAFGVGLLSTVDVGRFMSVETISRWVLEGKDVLNDTTFNPVRSMGHLLRSHAARKGDLIVSFKGAQRPVFLPDAQEIKWGIDDDDLRFTVHGDDDQGSVRFVIPGQTKGRQFWKLGGRQGSINGHSAFVTGFVEPGSLPGEFELHLVGAIQFRRETGGYLDPERWQVVSLFLPLREEWTSRDR